MEKIIYNLEKMMDLGKISDDECKIICLLIKAKTIEMLAPQAINGVGFAMEAISKIASSDLNLYDRKKNEN